ncbi:hypothetical protein NE237_029223 [Protea cynaroides]|uniref:Uncharacterized protein n=1 Tax=Protea cynaroides TaxID=273540 RepID=A0A9Q0GSR0_9MAGN|nr:hypothetical protein NE237_029223 [Protea cynaroides]
MSDFTMELFTLVAPNSLLVFGLCNLIIVILILSGLKSSSLSTQESFISAHEVPKRIEKEERGEVEVFSSVDIEASSFANAEKSPNVGTEESDNEDKCEADEDELRRRVEEFIDKVNRGWKEEKLMSSRSPIWWNERFCIQNCDEMDTSRTEILID